MQSCQHLFKSIEKKKNTGKIWSTVTIFKRPYLTKGTGEKVFDLVLHKRCRIYDSNQQNR